MAEKGGGTVNRANTTADLRNGGGGRPKGKPGHTLLYICANYFYFRQTRRSWGKSARHLKSL